MARKVKEPKPVVRRVRAKAVCASFDIEVVAEFKPHGLGSGEVDDVKRKLKQKLADSIASLPFAHIYPVEVRIR